MDVFIEVMKWVGIALAAGFVGYFGRYLAVLIIRKTRKKEEEEHTGPAEDTGRTVVEAKQSGQDSELEQTRLKIEKKKAKAEAKRAKKEGKK